MFLQWRGSVSSLLSVSLFTLCRGTGRNWSALTFRFAPLLRPPMPATAETQTLSASWPVKTILSYRFGGAKNCSNFETKWLTVFADEELTHLGVSFLFIFGKQKLLPILLPNWQQFLQRTSTFISFGTILILNGPTSR